MSEIIYIVHHKKCNIVLTLLPTMLFKYRVHILSKRSKGNKHSDIGFVFTNLKRAMAHIKRIVRSLKHTNIQFTNGKNTTKKKSSY